MSAAAFRFETGTTTLSGEVREVNEYGPLAHADRGVWQVILGPKHR